MLPLSIILILGLTALTLSHPFYEEAAVQHAFASESLTKPAKLKGRFLHITDLHLDPHYRNSGTLSSSCHRRKPKKEKTRGGKYGLPYGDCDSPLRLIDFTLDHLKDEWAKEVDFVIWTGDSARHDNDRTLPRTPAEIYDLNRAVVQKMEKIFTSRSIPVVPTIGNNDIWPHNIMTEGPNSITNEYLSIWKSFVPFPSYQIFQRGGYYSVDLIPQRMAAISLNTLYFYDSNKAVGGCEHLDAEDPGNLQFDWLEVQLDGFRNRGMQVWLTGHVPPSPGNYYPGCFVRYSEIALRFQDTILGHLYGHMNSDHFFFLEPRDTVLPEVEVQKKKKREMPLHKQLLGDFEELPTKPRNKELDDYVVVHVAPSVVPNPYVPSYRVYAYNITGELFVPNTELAWKGRKHNHRHRPKGDVDCKKKKNRDRWACRPHKPYHIDRQAPARINRLFTPLGYAQFWLPGIGNDTQKPRYELEYTTFKESALRGRNASQTVLPLGVIPEKLRGRQKRYRLKDLTIGSWVKLGRRIAVEKKTRKAWRRYMYLR